MPRLCCPQQKKKALHRPHTSRKQALAVIRGCLPRSCGGSATPAQAALSLERFC